MRWVKWWRFIMLLLLLHPFNGLFSEWGKRLRGFGMQWHQLDHMQTVCASLQTDNHTNTPSLNFTGQMLFLPPNQQWQSTEGKDLSCYSNKIESVQENVHMITDLPKKSTFKRYQWQTFLRVLPTRWRQKSAGLDMEQNYIILSSYV